MADVFLASYLGTHPMPKGVVNISIRKLDKADVSHSECVIGDPSDGAVVDCISSVGADGGVRHKRQALDPAYWRIQPMPWVNDKAAWNWLAEYEAAPYDYFGTGRFLLPFCLREHPEAWMCSECVGDIAGFIEPWRFTPRTLEVAVMRINSRANQGQHNG